MPIIQLRDNTPAAVGATMLINCPVGKYRYKNIGIELGDSAAGNGNAPAPATVILEIKVIYYNKIVRRVTAARLDSIQSNYGTEFAARAAVSGGANGTGRRHIFINFSEPWRKRLQDRDMLAWPTDFFGPKDVFQIQLTLAAGITPVINAWAEVDTFRSGGPIPIMGWETNDEPAVGSPLVVTRLNRPNLAFAELDIFDTSDAKTIDKVRIDNSNSGVVLEDVTKQQNASNIASSADMPNLVAGVFPVVFDMDDALINVQPAQGNILTITPSAAANGTMTIVSQLFGKVSDFVGA